MAVKGSANKVNNSIASRNTHTKLYQSKKIQTDQILLPSYFYVRFYERAHMGYQNIIYFIRLTAHEKKKTQSQIEGTTFSRFQILWQTFHPNISIKKNACFNLRIDWNDANIFFHFHETVSIPRSDAEADVLRFRSENSESIIFPLTAIKSVHKVLFLSPALAPFFASQIYTIVNRSQRLKTKGKRKIVNANKKKSNVLWLWIRVARFCTERATRRKRVFRWRKS